MITDVDIESAQRVSIEDEIRRRGIELKRQGAEFVGPCPVCGGRDRFSVNVSKQVFNCRGYGGGNVIGLVRHLDQCNFVSAVAILVGDGQRKPTPPRSPQEPDGYKDELRNVHRAEAIWRETLPLGPDAIAYFAKRKIDINQVPERGGLRFHPRCPWHSETKACIVGRFTTALGNEPRGIWRRPLTGDKPISLGPMTSCVIRLWPDEAVEQGLIIGEGVETVLAMATRFAHRGTLFQPAWACCTAGNLGSFPILPGIEALTVLVDNDTSGTGQKNAAKCAERWRDAGREVARLTTNALGTDFNDMVIS
jgi:Toprim domain-containing protein/CHC2-type zinc finger protein